jgi:hypothetical protein
MDEPHNHIPNFGTRGQSLERPIQQISLSFQTPSQPVQKHSQL